MHVIERNINCLVLTHLNRPKFTMSESYYKYNEFFLFFFHYYFCCKIMKPLVNIVFMKIRNNSYFLFQKTNLISSSLINNKTAHATNNIDTHYLNTTNGTTFKYFN